MSAGNPSLAAIAALTRQAGAPNPDDQLASGVGSPMPAYSGSLNDLAAQQIMSSSRQAQQEQGGLYGQAGDLENQRRALLAQQAQQAQAAVPNFRGMMRPITGQGIGHDILNGIRDLGVGALAVGSATVPGQAIEGALYAPQRQALAATASQLRSGEEAQKTGAQMYGAVSGEQARPFGAMAETGKTQQVGQMFQQTYAQKERALAQQFDIAMKRFANEKDIAKFSNATKTTIANLMAQVKEDAIRAGLDENAATNATREIGYRIIANSGFMRSNPNLSWVSELLGFQPQPGEVTYQPIQPPAQPTTQQGSKGGAPARPKGVPAGARWNPSTRTWQLHK